MQPRSPHTDVVARASICGGQVARTPKDRVLPQRNASESDIALAEGETAQGCHRGMNGITGGVGERLAESDVLADVRERW